MNTSKKQVVVFNKIPGWCTCLLLSSFLVGCPLVNDAGPNKENVLSGTDFSIKTDRDVYVMSEGGDPLEITYAYVNESKRAFYPGSCPGISSGYLEKLIEGDWILAHHPACHDVLRPPIEIKAGSNYEVTIQLHRSTWDSVKKNAAWYGGDIEGTYRIREKVYGEWSRKKFDNNTLKSEIVVSNTFDIQGAP